MRLRYSEVTPEPLYLNRRAFIVGAAATLAAGCDAAAVGAAPPPEPAPLKAATNPKFRVDEPPTKYESA
ncbi:MAG TPA: mononuclear molybdenum enzyme YedY, partial [Methylomirabilota bacterium]|nr:mononuclear molybdenum enzyme YedY [Methylomirabilota bacterium]